MPTPHTEPYDSDTLNSIVPQKSTKTEIADKLGEPIVTRVNGGMWIYGKSRRLAYGCDTYACGPLDDYQFLVLEFSGELLASLEIVEDWLGCSDTGICVSSGWVKTDEGHYILPAEASITSTRNEDIEAKRYLASDNECRLYIYNATFRDPWWGNFRPDLRKHAQYFQLTVGNVNTPQVDGQSYFSERLPSGMHDLIFYAQKFPEEPNAETYFYEELQDTITSITVDCETSKLIFLAVTVDLEYHQDRWQRQIRIESRSEEDGKRAISNRKLLLPN